MSIEPIISFFLIRHLLKNLKILNPDSKWIRIFRISMYGVVLLFVADLFLLHNIFLWPAHLVSFIIAVLVLKEQEFSRSRMVVYAVLPLMILSLSGDIIELSSHHFYQVIEDYLDIASIFAAIWMVAMLIISAKQNKALEAERRKTQAEEEQNKWITARKAELENEIIERTAEITQQKEELQHALTDLKSMQAQLVQQEKLASLGELTAGIAHEIQNPLNFVNNFSEISTELLNELKSILERLTFQDRQHTEEILADLTKNMEKITYHGKRADSIVKGMLQHSRRSGGIKEPTDINSLAEEYLRLSYHGFRAKDKTFNVTMHQDFDYSIEKINVVPQDIGRVLLNLFSNAFYSVSEKASLRGGTRESSSADPGYCDYIPAVSVSTKKIDAPSDGLDEGIEIKVKDNGMGIPQKAADKIFQPFFTTKPTGQGTGLGLSLSYDIIKAHGGILKAETRELRPNDPRLNHTIGQAVEREEGAEFIIQLPIA